MNAKNQPHRRYNPLLDRWVLVSPQRTQRPWAGQQDTPAAPEPEYLRDCYLCPGNARAAGETNPDYRDVHVFDNDFPALLAHGEASPDNADPQLRRSAVSGRCRVICYSPRHDLTMASMGDKDRRAVIDTWAQEIDTLSTDYPWVQVFENRGAAMGCSNMHPHGQIWALDAIPSEALVEDQRQRGYFAEHGRALLLDYVMRELALGERVVCSNEDWAAIVPWWAVWPYEILLLPRFAVAHLNAVPAAARDTLATILGEFLHAYDRLFNTPFPYSMGFHGRPTDGKEHPSWRLHAVYYPPLLRSATVRKFLVGFELTAEPQRDLTAEDAAARLREQSETHYRQARQT